MKNKKIKLILNEVLQEIQPDRSYEAEIFSRLNSIIQKINKGSNGISAILGGSGAKGTWLKTFDADIFVLFNYAKFKDKSEKLSGILEKILKKNFRNISRLHGSRDYFQIKETRFTFEIVPILKIQKAEQAKNITDISPLHSKWVSRHKKLSSQMKLAKQFCQAQNVYGAESYIRGFSGYVCEILAVYYGSFLNLIKNAAKWDASKKQVIDVQRHYMGKDVFKLVNTSKLMSPLVVIDPVQKGRNASAALSVKNFEKFRDLSILFLKSPSKDFFLKKELKPIFLAEKPKNSKLVIIKATPLNGKIDVVGSKLLKAYEMLKENLGSCGFNTLSSDWEWDKKNDAVFYFLFGKTPLPKNIEIEGPPLKIKNHTENFKRLHKRTFVRLGKIMAMEKRKFLTPEGLLRKVAKDEFIRNRCKGVKIEII